LSISEKIENAMELPFDLINLNLHDEQFIFRFEKFDDDQSDYTVQMGGLTGSFSVLYSCKGIESCFECDVTIGNVYDFYVSLNKAYCAMTDGEASAVLKDYGETKNRTLLEIKSDGKGHCRLVGSFLNKYTNYKSGINLSFEIDQSYIPEMLASFEVFFDKLISLQGSDYFC